MRILYLTHNITWKGGGAFFHAYHQARHLVRRGHQVTLLSIAPHARAAFHEFETAGVRIVETPDLLRGQARTGWDPWNVMQRIRYVGDEPYDIVHGLESRPAVALPALWLKQTKGTPTILDWADWYGRGGTASERGRLIRTFMQPVETFCEETFYPLADAVIAMGEPLLERAAALGIPRARMINLLNGCDPEGLATFGVEEARNRLPSVPGDAYVLGYVGVMRATTARLLFSALPLIKQLVQRPVKVLCIGNHKLKDLWSFVPTDCRDDVLETGWIDYDDLNVYLCASDVTVLPFQRMTATDNIWPSKLNDYLAAGRPTVATNMRILRSLFSAYDIGLLTDDTPHAFAQGVVTLLLSPEVRARQAVSARALAEGDLSWEHLVGQLEQFYVQLIDQMVR
jgi:glycosyltransferase involved in cell wall biosynthesis